MPADHRTSPATTFPRTRAGLGADRFGATARFLALAALALVAWGAWSVTARLALRPPAAPGATVSAPRAATPAALTLRAAGLRRPGR